MAAQAGGRTQVVSGPVRPSSVRSWVAGAAKPDWKGAGSSAELHDRFGNWLDGMGLMRRAR